jgi:hypothetical protein
MIKLSEDNLKELDAFLQEMPTKFGLPLLQYFAKLAEEQKPKEEKKEVKK